MKKDITTLVNEINSNNRVDKKTLNKNLIKALKINARLKNKNGYARSLIEMLKYLLSIKNKVRDLTMIKYYCNGLLKTLKETPTA